ncbi:MAG: response regulator transcription factor [Flavobacteriaceae bacterium]|nr:response regulator transcription factor [Flavobacteriaceae bacterium]
MFKKVLIADDLGSINTGVLSKLKELDITAVFPVQYCDDAYLHVKSAIRNEQPYDLLITDLGFKVDHRAQHYPMGEDLIEVLKKEHPDLKIIVFSVEDRIQKVRSLFQQFNIDAYICKGRDGLLELEKALQQVYDNKRFVSPQVASALQNSGGLDIDDYDLQLIKQLSLGLSQDEISFQFKKENITPSSLSSVEKRINSLKIQFKANNATHLVAIVKDLGLI